MIGVTTMPDRALTSLRHNLIGAWSRQVHGTSLNPVEQANMDELWHEITLVEAAGAWSALTALSLQLLEALLRRKAATISSIDLTGPTMGPLAAKWRLHVSSTSRGVNELGKDKPLDNVLIASSVVSAVTLRNWASHRDLRYRGASEMRATQALALLICLRVAIYPTERSPLNSTLNVAQTESTEWWWENFASMGSDAVNYWLSWGPTPPRLSQAPAGVAQSILTHALRNATASQALTTVRIAEKQGLPRSLIAEVLQASFAGLAQHTAQSRYRDVADLVMRFNRFGLKPHSRVLAAVLPYDGFTLLGFLPRSIRSLVQYLQLCESADPPLFRAVLQRDQELSAFAKELARHVGAAGKVDADGSRAERMDRHDPPRPVEYSANAGNVGLLLGYLPAHAHSAYVHALNWGYHNVWMADSGPRSWGPYLRVIDPLLNEQRRKKLEKALRRAVDAAPLATMTDVLFRYAAGKGFESPLVRAAGLRILERAVQTHVDRIDQFVWDGLLSGDAEIMAAALAAMRSCFDSPAARNGEDLVALRGVARVVQVAGVGTCDAGTPPTGITADSLPLDDRWRTFRITLGLVAGGVDIPAPVRARVLALTRSTTSRSSSELGKVLLAEVAAALADTTPVVTATAG